MGRGGGGAGHALWGQRVGWGGVARGGGADANYGLMGERVMKKTRTSD